MRQLRRCRRTNEIKFSVQNVSIRYNSESRYRQRYIVHRNTYRVFSINLTILISVTGQPTRLTRIIFSIIKNGRDWDKLFPKFYFYQNLPLILKIYWKKFHRTSLGTTKTKFRSKKLPPPLFKISKKRFFEKKSSLLTCMWRKIVILIQIFGEMMSLSTWIFLIFSTPKKRNFESLQLRTLGKYMIIFPSEYVSWWV